MIEQKEDSTDCLFEIEAFRMFQLFKRNVDKETGTNILGLRIDRGREFTSTEFIELCSNHGIHRQFTKTCRPQQNEVAERENHSDEEVYVAQPSAYVIKGDLEDRKNNDDNNGSDAASVITSSTSAWCETMYKLISLTAPPNQKPLFHLLLLRYVILCGFSVFQFLKIVCNRGCDDHFYGEIGGCGEILAPIFGNEHSAATQSLYYVSGCFKLAFMATSLAILEAIKEDDRKLHGVDFNIRKGDNGGDERLKKVGESQSQLAKEYDVGFKFNMVKMELAEMMCESLGCDGDESLVVNFAFKLYQMLD
ncbi:scarecrow-like protein 8 [Cucurbita moschata]|uniref:Scarecrow-like protein 8 n=1 Tax=Cucurbita moschata TaxID=3662 RepID=A0A6J1HE03_CUCMO|nr:scarecrow-like protein 8 [Cucurbita moschata]